MSKSLTSKVCVALVISSAVAVMISGCGEKKTTNTSSTSTSTTNEKITNIAETEETTESVTESESTTEDGTDTDTEVTPEYKSKYSDIQPDIGAAYYGCPVSKRVKRLNTIKRRLQV